MAFGMHNAQCSHNHIQSKLKQKGHFFASLVQTTSCATAFSVSNLQSTLLLLHLRQIDLFFKETKNWWKKISQKWYYWDLPRNGNENAMMPTTKTNKHFSQGMSALRNFRYRSTALISCETIFCVFFFLCFGFVCFFFKYIFSTYKLSQSLFLFNTKT